MAILIFNRTIAENSNISNEEPFFEYHTKVIKRSGVIKSIWEPFGIFYIWTLPTVLIHLIVLKEWFFTPQMGPDEARKV